MLLLRTHASIISGSGPDAAVTFMAMPSDPRSTVSDEEWRINAKLRLGLPLASYHNQPHAPCPHGCRHPQTNERIKVRWGWHLVTNCLKAKQGKKSHKDVESILIHYFNTYTHITATKAKPFANTNMQADILLSMRHKPYDRLARVGATEERRRKLTGQHNLFQIRSESVHPHESARL